MKVVAFLCLLLLVTVGHRSDSPYLISDHLRFGVTAVFVLIAGLVTRLAPRLAAVRALRQSGAAAWDHVLRHANHVIPLLALVVFAATVAICHLLLDPIAHISDEVSYLFQARVFASGHLSLPAPSLPRFFPAEWVVVHDGRWFSIFPPGWPLLLALGVGLGAPSLVNPLLGALTILVLHRLAVRLMGESKALVVALLCAASPFFLFMCSSFMSHPASLLFATATLALFLRATASGGAAAFALSGCCAGFGFLVRPLDAALLWSIPAAYLLLRHRTRRQLLGTSVSAAGLLVGMTAYFAYNHAFTGHWFTPFLALTSPHNRFGFGPDIGLPWSGFQTPGHGPGRAALNLNFNLAVMSADLFGWPVSSLWPILFLICFGRLAWPHTLSLLAALGLACAYALYWYHGVCFGARLYFSSLPFLLILTAEGLSQAPHILARRAGGSTAPWRFSVTTFVALGFVFSVVVYLPMVSLFEPYHNQRNVDRGIERFVDRQVAAEGIERGIVFVGPGAHDYGRSLVANALEPAQGAIIYAFDQGPLEDQQLIASISARPVFHYRQGDAARAWPPRLKELLHGWYLGEVLKDRLARAKSSP